MIHLAAAPISDFALTELFPPILIIFAHCTEPQVWI